MAERLLIVWGRIADSRVVATPAEFCDLLADAAVGALADQGYTILPPDGMPHTGGHGE